MCRFIKIYDVQFFESINLMREMYNYLFRKKPHILFKYIQLQTLKHATTSLKLTVPFLARNEPYRSQSEPYHSQNEMYRSQSKQSQVERGAWRDIYCYT